jgi:hypothetical protein
MMQVHEAWKVIKNAADQWGTHLESDEDAMNEDKDHRQQVTDLTEAFDVMRNQSIIISKDSLVEGNVYDGRNKIAQ